MMNSNGNIVSPLGENKKKKLIHRLEKEEEVKLQDASTVGSPQKRQAAVTPKTTLGEDTIER